MWRERERMSEWEGENVRILSEKERERERERERGGKKKTFLLMTFPVGLAEGEIKDRRFIEMWYPVREEIEKKDKSLEETEKYRRW